MKRSAAQQTPEVQIVAEGRIPADSADYARAKVLALAARTREPVLYARVKLSKHRDPAVKRSAIAQANLDVDGKPVRAHVAAETMREAIDLLQDRLERRLGRLNEHWEARRGRMPAPSEWRHGSEPAHRPDYYPRPDDDRQVVRHKSFSLARETPDEAAFELESMDYDFHLFTDVGSGQDSVIYRIGQEGGYRLAQVEPHPELLGPVAVKLTVSEAPAPALTLDEARTRLEITRMPFVFFSDAETGRGSVLYHRYDGHYGLITPVE